MRILFWGTYDVHKPRLRILRDGLHQLGVTVEEIHKDLWEGVADKSQIQGIGAKIKIALRWAFAYPNLILRLIKADRPDLILVNYPGLFDVFLATMIGKMRRIPVVWNVFLSLYDTIVEDRQLWKRGSIRAKLLFWLEGLALRCPKLAFMDTRAHARRIESLFSLPKGYCDAVWVGVESSSFSIEPIPKSIRNGASLQILFYGQFIPLHGIPVIIEAARVLQQEPVEWTLIGRGQEEARIRAMLDLGPPLPKLRWIEWATYEELRQHLAASDLCLGIFGSSDKAASVIPNKVFQILAAGCPLITRDSDAIRELLKDAPPCTYLIRPNDPAALVTAIRAHRKGGGPKESCHRELQTRIHESAIAEQFLAAIKRRLSQTWTSH